MRTTLFIIRKWMQYAAGLFCGWVASTVAFAAERLPAPGVGSSWLQMFAGLAAVLALVLAMGWMLRKIAGSPGAATAGIKVIGGTAVGPRERVVIVEISGTWLVLGVAPGRVSPLHTLPKATCSEVAAPAPGMRPAFAPWLERLLDKKHAA